MNLDQQARMDRVAESFDAAFAKVTERSDAMAEAAMGFYPPPPPSPGPVSPASLTAVYQQPGRVLHAQDDPPGRVLQATPPPPALPPNPQQQPLAWPERTDFNSVFAARLIPPKLDPADKTAAKLAAQSMSGASVRQPELSDDQQRWAQIAGAGSSSYANLRSKS